MKLTVALNSPVEAVVSYGYDANGNKISETDPNHNTRTFGYDALNRPVKKTDALGNSTTMTYDAVGNLLTIIDARLSQTRYSYDDLNRRTKTIDPAGVVTEYRYDRAGNKIGETWANGNVITNTYDKLNRLTSSTDSIGLVASATYDPNGNVLTKTDANHNTTTNTYDDLNQLRQSDMPENRTVKFEYDLVGNKTKQYDARNKLSQFTYDKLNRLSEVKDPLLQTQSFTYDPVGNSLTETDKRNFTTTWTYDQQNRVKTVTDALNQAMSYTYDAVGNKLTETDKRSIVTAYSYDKENRVLETKRDGVLIKTLEYDEVGNVKFDTDANGNITAYIYDPRNLVTKESRPLAAITNHLYDDMGDRIKTRDPEGRVTKAGFDLRRRMFSTTDGLGNTTEHVFDGNGNKLTTRRPNGNTWTFAYDHANRLTSVTDPLSGVTTFAYDENGNKLSQTDAKQYTTGYTYDDLNRLQTTTYVDGKTESSTYDANGNRKTFTDAKGQTFSYDYDELNREVTRTYPAPAVPTGDDMISVTTTYDANNNPLTITEDHGTGGIRTTTNQYDHFDRLINTTDGFNKTIAYTYDANGNRKQLTDADSNVTRYDYDGLNRLVNVTTAAGITNYAYDRSSLQTQVTYPNGTAAFTQFDAARRILSLTNKQGTAVISSYGYQYDKNGNRTQQTEINGGATEITTYTYDDNDRLSGVDYPDATVAYTYDANYNRLSEVSVEKTTGNTVANKIFSYNNRNQITGVSDAADASKSATYQYDANGNQIVKSQNGVTSNFIYDVRDQLVQVRQGATVLGQYGYNYLGMRVIKDGDHGLLHYTYDDRSVLMQSDAGGTTVAKYEYGPHALLSLNHASEGRQYYLFDALGSVVNLTKADGSLQTRYQYDAWGNPRASSGSSFNDFGFTGHEKDNQTGLYYFKARFYDPSVGRFLNQDSYLGEMDTPPSLHRYLYAYGNPTVYVDLYRNFSVLRDLGNYFADISDTAFAAAGDMDNQLTGDLFADSWRRAQAIGLGSIGALTDIAGGITNSVNFVGNAAYSRFSDDTDIQSELDQSFSSAEQSVNNYKTAARESARNVAQDPASLVGFSKYVGGEARTGLSNTFIEGKGSSLAKLGAVTTTAILPTPPLLRAAKLLREARTGAKLIKEGSRLEEASVSQRVVENRRTNSSVVRGDSAEAPGNNINLSSRGVDPDGIEGLTRNPIDMIRSRVIERKALNKNIEVIRERSEKNYVDIVDGKPVIHLNTRASSTATIEEYMHARIIQRSLDKGISVNKLRNPDVIFKEEVRLKTRLIKSNDLNTLGGNPLKVDVDSLERTRQNYIIQNQVLKNLNPNKSK